MRLFKQWGDDVFATQVGRGRLESDQPEMQFVEQISVDFVLAFRPSSDLLATLRPVC